MNISPRSIDARQCHQSLTVCLLLLLVVLVSGCAFFDPASPMSMNLSHSVTPVPTPIGIMPPICRLAACTNFHPFPGVPPFSDTWENVHRFLTFDYNVIDFVDIAKNYDFIWGTRPSHVAIYRSINSHIMLSYYMTLQRDNGASLQDSQNRSFDYWKQMHPDWILYKCDRRTPAYEVYNDNNSDVPFVLSNPAMRAWQIATYIKPASKFGYDALAVDNVNMENLFGACGYYDTSGNWVQRYSGDNDDPQWQADIADWMAQMQQVLHSLPHPMLLIINFGFGSVPLDSDASQHVLAHADGILDETGFAHYGEYYLSATKWLEMVHFIDQMQRENKPFFSINEFQHGITHDDIQWALASYLMCKQRLAMLYFTNLGQYGENQHFPEYTIPIGSPLSEMYFAQHVYWRDYSGGEVIVNSSDTPVTITPPPSQSYVDIYGAHTTTLVTLPAHAGKILLLAHEQSA